MSVKHLFLVLLISAAAIGALFFEFPPITQDVYGQASSTETSGVSITISGPGGGGGGGTPSGTPADIIFGGFSSPDSTVTFLRNGTVVGTTITSSAGTFLKSVSVKNGLVTLGIRSKDRRGLTTATSEITINLLPGNKVGIANIFLSPTITADRFKIQKGRTLRIFGSTFPESLIRLFNNFSPGGDPIAEIRASSDGTWEYFFPGEDLGEGTVSLKVNSQIKNPFLVSPFSSDLEFTIVEIKCSGADFNFDTHVNIIDFSILIFYWQKDPSIGDITNICTDLNTDKIVDIFDFSILMHQWTD